MASDATPAGRALRGRGLHVWLVVFVVGLISGGAGIFYFDHYAARPLPPQSTPYTLVDSSATGANTSTGTNFRGNFSAPGAVGDFVILIIQIRSNVSANLLGSTVYVDATDGTVLAQVLPVLNSPG